MNLLFLFLVPKLKLLVRLLCDQILMYVLPWKYPSGTCGSMYIIPAPEALFPRRMFLDCPVSYGT